MPDSNTTQLSVKEAVSLLKKYSCNSVATIDSTSEREQVRQGLLLVTSLSEWENFGICADNKTQGVMALESYLQALGYKSKLESYSSQDIREQKAEETENSAVYIKFNTQKLSYYIDSYVGEYRGVLVAIQGEDDQIVGTYGYFPLDLFTK
ncbi:MAG: DUF1824 family protein [Xenococcaceae cyanobacterium MO_167.B27]|nr:DUF1824 family protein [Xenococcaceae cyanobacterium MO_167.B27]